MFYLFILYMMETSTLGDEHFSGGKSFRTIWIMVTKERTIEDRKYKWKCLYILRNIEDSGHYLRNLLIYYIFCYGSFENYEDFNIWKKYTFLCFLTFFYLMSRIKKVWLLATKVSNSTLHSWLTRRINS